jgi:hypothetical protein
MHSEQGCLLQSSFSEKVNVHFRGKKAMYLVKKIYLSTIVLYLIVLMTIPAYCAAEERLIEVRRDPHSGQVVVYEVNRPVLQYNYLTVQPPDGFVESVNYANRRYARARSNYIHPLYGPDGEVLTMDWSRDHPHHRGIYWAWPEVDWRGQRGDLHALQGVIVRPTGNIELHNGDDYAEIRAENRWMWKDETPIVREVTIIRAYRADEHGRYIDLTFHFETLGDDVALARRGTDKYGGLNIRLSTVKDLQLLHHVDLADASPRRAWSDSIGVRRGGTKPVGLAVFEKAANPDYPGGWIEYPELPWFQPAFPAQGTRYVLKKGQPLKLQYRLWIRSGSRPSDTEYIQHWETFHEPRNATTAAP